MRAFNDETNHLLDFILSPDRGKLVAEEIERWKTELPTWVTPNYTTVAVASEEFQRAAGHVPGLMPEGWRSDRPDIFWKPVGCWATLQVRKFSGLWTIERERGQGEILYQPGSIICTRTKEAAMRLAEFCYPFPEGLEVWPRWKEITKR